jgi:hypothetical protein
MRGHSIDVRIVTAAAILICGLSFATTGCGEKNVHASAPAVAPVPAPADRPMNTAPDTDASPPVQAATPPPVPAASATAPPVTIPATKPAAPRKPAGQPAAESNTENAARPPAPQISPQLSPSDQETYARKTGDDVAVAERNLAQANGRQLNAAQQDLVEKIRSFLAQSRDASKGGDWARAQNLSQKARLLSVELLNSL